MDTSIIEEFFYSRASRRIAERVKASGLKYAEIYKPDHKQISRIVNNERNKNNRFLICDAVLHNSYPDEETGKYIECGLLATKELHFNSRKDILWGTDSEIEDYLYCLFLTLWNVYSDDNKDSEIYLCDYIPYAKNSTYHNILFDKNNHYPAIFYGIKEDTILEELEASRETALFLLYQKCKQEFYDYFMKFIEAVDENGNKIHYTFHKLDKFISHDIYPSFISIMKKYKPNPLSLGLRVRDLITADLSNSASMIASGDFDSYMASLINASSNYILSLEKIQKDYLMKKGNKAD